MSAPLDSRVRGSDGNNGTHGNHGNVEQKTRQATCAPLADLNAYIRGTVQARRAAAGLDNASHPDELFSAGRFRKTWESGRTLDRLQQAVARTPANAGPLNSHALVLRSLALMGELSTDYLRRFLVQVETLQWLEKAREKYPREQAKAGKAAKRRQRKK